MARGRVQQRGSEITIGELRAMPIGAQVIAQDDNPRDVRIRSELVVLQASTTQHRNGRQFLELTFHDEVGDPLDVTIAADIYRDYDLGVSLAGRGTLHLYHLPKTPTAKRGRHP